MHPRNHLALLALSILVACVPAWGPGISSSAPGLEMSFPAGFSRTPSLTPFQPEGFIPSSLPTVTLAFPASSPAPQIRPPAASLWISPAIPFVLRQYALASGLPPVPDQSSAAITLDVYQPAAAGGQQSEWVYALVAPFPTVPDNISSTDLRRGWAGEPAGPFAGRPLWMEASTLAALTAIWGPPASGSVRVADSGALLDAAWAERPAWGIVPFEALEPRWKVLSVDGQSPIRNDFDVNSYPLKVAFWLNPAGINLPGTNRDASKLTSLVMTGVTALVRGTANRMERYGILYPGRDIRDTLRGADLTHISNEIPFDANCPTPDPNTDSLRFCSDPRYIALLEDVGTDIVELTGNHMLDYGPADALGTMDMYSQRGWQYYGGGRDLQDSLKSLVVENHGNKLGFLGCNLAGPAGDWASESRPGSTPCNFDWMQAEIARLRAAGVLPIVTFQYYEYYFPSPTASQQSDFRRMAEAGAVIVSGSQAHVPASMEFHDGAFIHYGLGNLFFDQMSYMLPSGERITDTRREFLDRHVFYAGKYINVELLTYMLEDYARPRPMTDTERIQLLQDIFRAGVW